jgi:predicted esterase
LPRRSRGGNREGANSKERIVRNRIPAVSAVVLALIISIGHPLHLSASNTEDEEYREFRAELIELYQAEKYEETAALIEKNFDRFPGSVMKMSYNMALVCTHLEEYAKGLRYLRRAHEKGQWFGIWAFEGDFWAPYREIEGFEEFLSRNLEMKDAAQKKAKPRLEVVLPAEFDTGKRYPLFIALHGGGENIDNFKPQWRSGVMEKEFIVAYVQSSQVSSMDGFTWDDQDITKREVREAYEKVRGEYPVDEDEVIVGGFSSGGYASLVVTFFDAVPVTGFVILCPPMPDNITEADVLAARERGVRGTLITTELDQRVPNQRTMADLFRKAGLQYQFIMTPNIGHWYPEDLPALIDRAIAHIRSG